MLSINNNQRWNFEKNRQRIRARIRRLGEGLYGDGDCHLAGEGFRAPHIFLTLDTGFILARIPTILRFYCVAMTKIARAKILKTPRNIGRIIKIMAKERTYKTSDESEETYYRNHPDEINEHLTTAFEEYAKNGEYLSPPM